MPSKLVVDRKKSADAVIAATQTHAEAIGQALTQLFAPHLTPHHPFDFTRLVHLLGQNLQAVTLAMEQADEAHSAELRDDEEPRQKRDAGSAALYANLVSLRDSTIAIYGAPVARALGFLGETPTDPVALSRLAAQVQSTLSTLQLPAPRLPGASLDLHATAAALEQQRTALDTHIKDVAREAREAQATLTQKNRAIAAYDEQFSSTATTLAGLLGLAGFPEHAERVRPSRRKPGQTADSDVEEAGIPTTGLAPSAASSQLAPVGQSSSP